MKNRLITLTLLLIGTILGSGANFIVQLYLARELSVYNFGFYTSILNISNLLTPLIAFGITGFMLKVYAEEGYIANRWLDKIYQVLIATSLIVFLIHQLVNLYVNKSLEYSYIYGCFFIYMLSVSYNSFMILRLQIEGKYKAFSIWQTIPNSVKLLSVFLITGYLGNSLINISYAYLITGIIITLISLTSLHKMKVGKIKLANEPVVQSNSLGSITAMRLLLNSMPYGLTGVFYLIYFQSNIVLLSFISGYESVAYYGLAMTIATAACLPASIFFQKLLMPTIHYWATHDTKKLFSFYKKNILISTLVALLVAITNIIFTKFFLTEVFGEKYEPAKEIFYLISLVIIIKYINLNSGAIMSTGNLIKTKNIIMMKASGLNIFLCLCLTYSLGLKGAVISTFVVECYINILNTISINKELNKAYA